MGLTVLAVAPSVEARQIQMTSGVEHIHTHHGGGLTAVAFAPPASASPAHSRPNSAIWPWAGATGIVLIFSLLVYFGRRKPAELQAAVKDATAALQKSQSALQRTEELYMRATRAGKVGVWDWNLETDEIAFSQELERMLDCPEGEHITNFEDFKNHVSAGDADRQRAEALTYLANDTAEDFVSEYSHQSPNREIRWFVTRANTLYNQTGRAVGLTGTDTDITETKTVQDELIKAKEQAEAANRTKTDFLANISHELRTPLNSVLGFSELIRSETFGPVGNPKYREYADDIHGSGAHLLEVINEILDVSRVEAGALDLHEGQVDLAAAFETCLTMIVERADKGGITVDMKIADGLSAVRADDTRLKQIILNLLSNAVKFTPPDGRITLAAELGENGDLLISVRDTGIGINARHFSHIFEPFVQVENVLQRSHEGSGLGLTLVQSLTRLHGGTVTIDSQPGEGNSVTIQLPASRLVDVST
ncbi:MAG: PAS domain-containing protein [Rhodospirillaceae bacterium]|nr:PAS domain-containing protein [Rhodospirillaceae bacterium]MBT7512137.1 PAS domain-containing protein [Rhodospirillaceae bacterium]